MKIKFEVTTQDGIKHDVVAEDVDIIALEEKFDIDATILPTRQRMVWLAFLAWNAMSRKNLTSEAWDTWKTKSLGEVSPAAEVEVPKE